MANAGVTGAIGKLGCDGDTWGLWKPVPFHFDVITTQKFTKARTFSPCVSMALC